MRWERKKIYKNHDFFFFSLELKQNNREMDQKGDQRCRRLLDLIPNERELKTKSDDDALGNGFLVSEEEKKKLELRLGPPGDEYQTFSADFSPSAGTKRGYSTTQGKILQQQSGFLQLQTKAEVGKELAQQKISGRAEELAHNTSQTRAVSTPVVGWPPIRAFRKNLASTSNKPSLESQKGDLVKDDNHNRGRGLFVKINMVGVPIGRKVDLKAYNDYDKLASGVDELFRGLLQAQRHPISVGAQKHVEKGQEIKGLVDGSGEYTLVYEDDEGDQMLVGDVPWEMFISAAKRLRVLKTSELSSLRIGNRKGTARRC